MPALMYITCSGWCLRRSLVRNVVSSNRWPSHDDWHRYFLLLATLVVPVHHEKPQKAWISTKMVQSASNLAQWDGTTKYGSVVFST